MGHGGAVLTEQLPWYLPREIPKKKEVVAAAANQNWAGQLENPRQYSVATSDRYRKLRSDPRLRKQRAF